MFSEKKVLIVDDHAGMRTQLQMSLSDEGFKKLHVVSSIKDAIARMRDESYDIILCEYFLGDGTNGQQFLEYLRTRDVISRNTIFVIVTSERAYERVVVAAECAPDDYLLKPFTAAQLVARLTKLVERQIRFLAIDKAADARNWARVAAECDMLIAEGDKYAPEAGKIKGLALIKGGRPQEAADLFRDILEERLLPWAKLGLARALAASGDRESAVALAGEVIAENEQFMAAYDFLGELLTAMGDKAAALEVLQSARQVSPGTLNRIRHVAELAIDTGQFDVAERVMSEALAKHKYSPVREAQDYALLSRTLVEQGLPDKALEVLKRGKGSFVDDISNVVLATSESVAHRVAGHREQAEAALKQALAANHGNFSPSVVAAVADACFALGKEAEATELLKQVVQNNPDDISAHEQVHAVLTSAGKDRDEASALIAASVQEVIHINNEGVRKAKAGQLDEAVALLCSAADRLPNNLQIVSNAALALALDLARNGYITVKMNECLRYRQMVLEKSPAYPRLAEIDAILKTVQNGHWQA